MLLGYAWRSTEYLVASNGTIFKCRTVRRRADDVVYDVKMTYVLGVRFEDYTLKGAKTSMHVRGEMSLHRSRLVGPVLFQGVST